MDLLTFTAEIAKALAWPMAAVAISLIFRRQIQTLLARMKRGKLGPAEFEFEEAVRELTQEEPLPHAPNQNSSIEMPGALRVIAEPRAVVLEAWLKVEGAMETLARKSGHFNALAAPGEVFLARSLQKAGVLKPEHASLYRELRHLRNRAAHESDFTPSVDSVLAYIRITQDLEAALVMAANAL